MTAREFFEHLERIKQDLFLLCEDNNVMAETIDQYFMNEWEI